MILPQCAVARTDKIWIGSDWTHKTWIASSSIKETQAHLKRGAFEISIENGQVVSLDQDDEERSGFFLLHSVVKTYRFLLCI